MKALLAIACLSATLLAGCGGSQSVRDNGEAVTSPAEVNVQLGIAYMRRGEYEVALQKLQRAVRQDPEYPEAHTGLAVLYEQIGEPGKAREHYEEAVSLAPESGSAQNNLGQFLCKQGEYKEAEKHFLRALDDPFYKTPEVAYTNAGVCVQQIPAPERAETYFRAALDERSEYPTALYRLSRLMFERGDYLSARAFLQRYSAVAPMTPEALLLGVRIERRMGDEEAADGYATALNKQFPDSPEARRLADSSENE